MEGEHWRGAGRAECELRGRRDRCGGWNPHRGRLFRGWKGAAGEIGLQRVVEETTSLLAGGLVNMCAVPAPEVVVLGGGVAWAGEALVGPIRHGLGRSLPTPPRCVLSELELRRRGWGRCGLR